MKKMESEMMDNDSYSSDRSDIKSINVDNLNYDSNIYINSKALQIPEISPLDKKKISPITSLT